MKINKFKKNQKTVIDSFQRPSGLHNFFVREPGNIKE
jgi:hypothetical protein